MNVIFLLFSIFHAATCFGRQPVSCSDVDNQDCQYIATWRTRGDRVEFTIAAQTQGWVGIGFSTNQMMVSTFCEYHHDFYCPFLIYFSAKK